MLPSIKKMTFTDWLLLAAILFLGSFHEFLSCGLSIAMCSYLFCKALKKKQLTVPVSLPFYGVVVLSLFYGLSILWAVDKGMAFVGFMKFMPLPLYLLCLRQEEKEGCILQVLPYVAAAVVVISTVGMHLPGGQRLFSVADRLAGCFQYPNTFALLLLVCQLLLLKKEGKRWYDYAIMAVLIAGLLYTGSRTVFVVAVIANIAMLFLLSQKRGRAVLLALAAAGVLTVVILALSGNAVIGRFLRFSLTESTLVGRILYVADALPLLLRYPFGMGYMGYAYIQGSIQTGVYSVTYIHNELLQLLLDIGWLPVGLCLFALGKWFCKAEPAQSILVGAVCLHSLFDFNLQYVGMFLLLLLLTDVPGKTVQKKARGIGAAAVAAVSLYMGIALLLGYVGAAKAADAMYPGNTRNKLTMLEQVTTVEEADRLSDEILRCNKAYFAPYLMKGKFAYAQGDFGSVIRYFNQAIEKNPFDHTLYEEYGKYLAVGIELYQKAGDQKSAAACAKELMALPKRLSANESRLSTLGSMIADQPVTELSEQLQALINQLGGMNE